MPPPVEVCDLNGLAILWPFVGYRRNGEVIVGEPVEVPVRWTWGRSSMVTTDGTRVAVDAKVVVDRDIAEDSLMWEGEMVDLSGTGSTGPTPGDIMRVSSVSYSPDLRYDPRNTRREVGLMYYKGRLPPVVPE